MMSDAIPSGHLLPWLWPPGSHSVSDVLMPSSRKPLFWPLPVLPSQWAQTASSSAQTAHLQAFRTVLLPGDLSSGNCSPVLLPHAFLSPFAL